MEQQRKYKEPYILKAKILAWSEFNINEIDLFLSVFKSENNNEIFNFFEKMFDLRTSSPREKILIDLHYYAIKFAIENNFTKIQISSFVSIIRSLHRATQETPFDNYQYLLKYFQELIICHSIKRPPFCIDIFDNQTAIKVINYINNTYMKNYKLYKYAFTPITGMHLKINYQNRTPSPELLNNFDEDPNSSNNPSQTASTMSSFRPKSSIANSNNENMSSEYMEMKNFVKNVLTDHIKSENVQQFLKQIENDEQLNGSKPPSRPLSKNQKKK